MEGKISAVSINEASLEYCTKLLTNREPTSDFTIDLGKKRDFHLSRMSERSGSGTVLKGYSTQKP